MIILGTNSIKDTGYEVANSLRFDDGSGAELTRSQGSSPSSQRLFTFSGWYKKATITPSSNQQFFSQHNDTTDRMELRFQQGDTIDFRNNAPRCRITTNRLFRDFSAWYHVCLRVDTTQSTAANRIRLYINGVQETSFSTADYGDQNDDLITDASTFDVGDDSFGNAHFDGYMCEVVYCDGQSLDPTSFGEFDSDSGIWKPIDVSGLTFGTNGFYLDFEDSAALGDDVSGNNNDFTVNNLTATDQSTDTCTNNFATLNSLEYSGGGKTFSEGNCKQFLTGVANFTRSTIGVASGKWYCEVKLIAGVRAMYGISSYLSNTSSNYIGQLGNTTTGYSYGIIGNTGRLYHAGSSTASWVSTVAADDIVMIAMDLDNYKLYFGKNGTWERSGDPTSGATGTGAYTIVAPSLNGTGFYHFAFGCNSTSEDNNSEMNLGGCSGFAVSSANQDGDGYGNFEYAVPSGYYSLCTKNLAEYG